MEIKKTYIFIAALNVHISSQIEN